MTSCTILAPLSSFGWTGTEFAVPDLGRIIQLDEQPDLSSWRHLLAEFDREKIGMASHWLEFKQRQDERVSSSEKVNLFLLSLWLVKPTMTHVKFRFKHCDDGSGGAMRLLSPFGWIEEDVALEGHTTAELETAAQYFAAMLRFSRHRRRVWNALILTFQACTADQWQVKLVCFSAAVEALLKYQQYGVAKQVARTYACLVARTKRDRDREYRALRKSYATRSEVVHGRADRLRAATRLKKLARIAAQLRQAWRQVLPLPELSKMLDGDDSSRKRGLEPVERGYSPPS